MNTDLRYVPRTQSVVEGEVALKVWVADEARRTGRTMAAIYKRIYSGCYPDMRLRRVNKRVVFVKTTL